MAEVKTMRSKRGKVTYDSFVDKTAREGIDELKSQGKIEGTDIEQTCIRFANLLYGTDKAESFIFCTDPHVCNPPDYDAENKMLTNFGILKTYYDATPTNFVVCGGDWLNDIGNGQTNEDACYKLGRAASWMRANFDRFYTAIGNHEDNYPYGAAYEGAGRYTVESGLSMETIRNLMLPNEQELYYSFDGAQTKFYVMNSGDVESDLQMTDYRWGQVAWLAERLKEDDAENSALVIHAGLTRNPDNSAQWILANLSENLLKLCQAYNNNAAITLDGAAYDFVGCKGCVRFMLAGHVHDADCVETHYDIPVILTYNMDRHGYDYSNPVFDLCLADYDAKVMNMVRVGGLGTDREIPLARKSHTNLADPTSEDWLTGDWLTSNGELRGGDGGDGRGTVTNYIPVTKGDVLRFKGFYREVFIAGYLPVLVWYDENKVRITSQFIHTPSVGTASGLPVSAVYENGVMTHTVIIQGDTNEQYEHNNICDRVKYVRLCAIRTAPLDEVVITINEEIE